MSELESEKLHVTFKGGIATDTFKIPRCYTLTHSDFTGELFLTIGREYDRKQISGLYTRLMRDEVLAEWVQDGKQLLLKVHVHVSGGLAVGGAKWRYDILHYHMPMVLEAFTYGDRSLILASRSLQNAPVKAYFHATNKKYDVVEDWGTIKKYLQQ